ncbi:MAG: ABC transporter substrate-binding protein [Candidatus Krumholzibacteriia bacterium]
MTVHPWRWAKTFVLSMAFFAISLAALAGCGGGATPSSDGTTTGAETPQQGGTLNIATPGEPLKLDPQGAADLATQQVVMQLYDQLVVLLPGSDVPQPGLAESWTISEDGLTYTFKLRAAKFSDGQPVTAEDAKFSIERAKDPKADPGYAQLFSTIQSIDAPDSSTLVLRLSAPTPALLGYLTFGPGSIIPKAYFAKVGLNGFNKSPIGSGPFKLEEFLRGQRVVLTRNTQPSHTVGLIHPRQLQDSAHAEEQRSEGEMPQV